MRQVSGMTEKEGPSAPQRLTMWRIEEAMLVGPRFRFEESKALADWYLVGRPNRVDLLMKGMARRDPDHLALRYCLVRALPTVLHGTALLGSVPRERLH